MSTNNGQATYRKGEYFRKELKVDNSVNAVWQGITNVAVLQQGGMNPDIVVGESLLPMILESSAGMPTPHKWSTKIFVCDGWRKKSILADVREYIITLIYTNRFTGL